MIWFHALRNRLQKSLDQLQRLLRKRNARDSLVNLQQLILLLSLDSRIVRAADSTRVEVNSSLVPSNRLPSSISSRSATVTGYMSLIPSLRSR